MNLVCLLSIKDGMPFTHSRANPFRLLPTSRPGILLPIKPVHHGPLVSAFAAAPASGPAEAAERRRQCAPSWLERLEGWVLKLLVVLLALTGLGCGFGVQHIAYVRQKSALCRQLRHKEIELQTAVQTCRTLEAAAAAIAAENSRRLEVPVVVAKPTAAKGPTRI
jgi:hypothetical protein